MAKITCTEREYDRLMKVLNDNADKLIGIQFGFEVVEELDEIPKDYRYDTETREFLCYRHKYTGQEIHILKDPKTYILSEEGKKHEPEFN